MKLISLLVSGVALLLGGCANVSSPVTDAPGDAPTLVKFTALSPGLEIVRHVGPDYPQTLYSAGVSGRVKVAFDLNSAGEVIMARVVESTDPRFEVPSIKGILKWRFKPGSAQGEVSFEFESHQGGATTLIKKEEPVHRAEADPQPFTGDYILVKDADEKPSPKELTQPAFPIAAARRNLAGSVDIAFIIDASGNTTQIRVIKATTPDFAASAVSAVEKWRFVPARKGGKTVACLVYQNLDFSLEH